MLVLTVPPERDARQVEFVDHTEIRVVLTDIHMPGTMDGLALSHYVRERWPPTVIVIGSGRRTPSEDDMASGALFLPKPYVPQALTKILDDIRRELA